MVQSQLSSPSRQQCYLQEKLPAELRNEIYELVFTTTTTNCETSQGNGPATVDLFHATPPSKALILTCRQFRAEACDMYRTAYRSYWENTSFTINGNTMTRKAISSLHEEDLQHIKNLKATGSTPINTTCIVELLCVDGAWHYTETRDTGTSEMYCVLTARTRQRYKFSRTESEAVQWSAVNQDKLAMKEQLYEVREAYRL